MELIKHLSWRYATKKFDATKKVSEESIELLEEAIRLSASSYGFQPYKVMIISQDELRQQLRPLTWDQSQVVDASHLFVFCSQLEFTDEQVDEYITRKSETQGIPLDKLGGYADFMKTKLKEKSPEIMKHWTAKQTYLALGNLLAACAELKIDTCPMEGFEAAAYDKILGLKDKGLTTTVLMAVGYRSEKDKNQHLTKVRKNKGQLFGRFL